MPRPKNKEELLNLSQQNFKKLFDFIETFTHEEQQQEFPAGTLNRNIRDVLGHIHEWHLMFMDWYQTGNRGEKPDIPAKGYTWKTVPELNRQIQSKYASEELVSVKQKLKSSHQQVRDIIEAHNDEVLFEKKRFKWTGTTSLGAYLISATSSHYDWGLKLIKKAKST
jgi:hypothetical protein